MNLFRTLTSDLGSLIVFLLGAAAAPAGQSLTINNQQVHLGKPGSPEWDEFAADSALPGRHEFKLEAEPNAEEATLFIRQDDVKQEWRVELNGKPLGKLFLMEADLVQTIAVPAGGLRKGENVLAIIPPKENDDIILGTITLDPRPLRQAHDAALVVTVVGHDGAPLPCRITVVDERGTLAPLISAPDGSTADDASPPAVRPGVAYTGNGRARIALPPGRYTIFASRGFEYDVARQGLEVAAGESREINCRLTREVDTTGWVSCDTHVHTLTYSGHGDATVDERMLTLAGEGIELPIAAEHNRHVDYSAAARRQRVSGFFTPVVGNEVTTAVGHFNIFPADSGGPAPDARLTDWSQLLAVIRATKGVRVVVLNHPRSIHSNFRPFDRVHFNASTGENKRGGDFTFDAIEILNSGAQQTDYLLVYRDWFALLNYGYRIISVGASDSHDVSRFIVGQARTYIAASDERAGQIDIAAACESLLAGRALVSMGLLTTLKVQDRFKVGDLATGLPAEVQVEVIVRSPSWAKVSNVALYANGTKIREATDGKNACRWSIPRPRHDVHLVAIATGPAVTMPFWAMSKPYQPNSTHWEGRAIGSTNPVWLDADGDGQFTAARAYARRLVDLHGTDPKRLLPALSDYDEAIAAQVASLCAFAGAKLDTLEFAEALRVAAPAVVTGFSNYIAAAAP